VWLELALLEQGELFAQEKVLGSQCAARPGNEHQETDEITSDEGQRVAAVCQQFEDGAGHERSALHVTRRDATANWRPGEISADQQAWWQPAHVERVIGTIRREGLDRVIIVNEAALHRHLKLFREYYHQSRTHLSLEKDTPERRSVQPPESGRVVAVPQVGGLHHRYERRAA
jgi:hypothetical protein